MSDMDDLTGKLMKHFKKETAWRPGLGLWIGDTVQKLFAVNKKIDSGQEKIKELQTRLSAVEAKIAAAEKMVIGHDESLTIVQRDLTGIIDHVFRSDVPAP